MKAIHPHFQHFLDFKSKDVIDLYMDLRTFILEINPECNELLYHTHALTSVYTLSEKMSDGYCLIPIYTNHMNLGFQKGTLLDDHDKLLQGTGKLMRHIPINSPDDYRNPAVQKLINQAMLLSHESMKSPDAQTGQIISKIKTIK